MRVKASEYFRYTLFFLCLITNLTAQASWQKWGGKPSIVNKIGEHEFLAACRGGHLEAVKFYLAQNGFNPDAYFESGKIGTQLKGSYVAALVGESDVLNLLMDKGADVNGLCNGDHPLLIAVRKGHFHTVSLLLEKGANVNAVHAGGITALYIAAQLDHYDIASLLLDKGANVKATCESGATPLFIAAQKGHYDMALLLLDKEAVVDAARCDKITPLYIAAQNGHYFMVRLLLNREASPLGICSFQTPLKAAETMRPETKLGIFLNHEKWEKYTQIIELLKTHEGKIDHSHRNSSTTQKNLWVYLTGTNKAHTDVPEPTPLSPAMQRLSLDSDRGHCHKANDF